MAIELCSNTSTGLSPRISFSHDFCLSDAVLTNQQKVIRSNSTGSIDFDFCTRKSFDQESSLADELFCDGKILPTEIKKKKLTNDYKSLPAAPSLNASSSDDSSEKEKTMKEMKGATTDIEPEEKASNSKSFWRFKRSSSLNCVSGYGRSLCPLPLLSRSKSTGSTPNSVKRAPLSKYNNSIHKQQKQGFIKSNPSSLSSSNYQRPPLKKNRGSFVKGVRINPVLNVSSGNLFGLGSILFNAKDKNRKK